MGARRSHGCLALNEELFELVLEHPELAELDVAERRLAIRSLVRDVSPAEPDPARLVGEVAAEIDGFGPLTPVMDDPAVTDVFVNGPSEVWVERDGELARAEVAFPSYERLTHFIERVLAAAGARVDVSRPIADARLTDGSRMHVVVPPLAPRGPLVSIRRWPKARFTLERLVALGMMTAAQHLALAEWVRGRSTIVISGSTGTGKTTLLNALLSVVPGYERVVTIEETPELRPACAHHVSLIARAPTVEGRGEVGLATLVRAALRMRPDRIVVGEVRGAEVSAALTAMSTGHRGSMLTLHAGSPDQAVERMVAMAGASVGASEASLRHKFVSAIDVVVQLERASGGLRRVSEIVEIT